MTVQGIDISNLQGAGYNWQQWKDRISFGMCKATEGDWFTDPDIGANWDAMWRLSDTHTVPRFAYSFFHAGQDPAVQAAHLVATVKGHGLLPGDNFVLDVEETGPGRNDGLTPAQCAPRAVECLRKINEYAPGHRVLPYMNPSWARAGGSAGMGSWFPWIADYGVHQPDVPPPWTGWTFWQYSDEPVDGDRFNGTEAGLLKFCRMPASR
jgi:lysozyme